MFIIIFFLALELKTQKPSGSQPVHLIAPRYELGYHRPEELGPFLANYVERRFGETSQKRRAPEGGGGRGGRDGPVAGGLGLGPRGFGKKLWQVQPLAWLQC